MTELLAAVATTANRVREARETYKRCLAERNAAFIMATGVHSITDIAAAAGLSVDRTYVICRARRP